MTPEQITFVQDQLASGVTRTEIEQTLLTNGYSAPHIQALFVAVSGGDLNGEAQVLPSVGVFLKRVLVRVKEHTTLGAIFVAYSAVISMVLFALEQIKATSPLLEIPFLVAAVVSIPLSMIISAMTMRHLLSQDVHPLVEDFSWAMRNFGSLLWVGLLSGLVSVPGFLFFIIPGIALVGYMALAQAVRIQEGVRGINALIRSTELVVDRWWDCTLRMSAVALPAVILASILTGIISIFVGETSVVGNLVGATTQGVASFIIVVAVVEIYRAVSIGRAPFDPSRPTPLRTLYRILAWFTPVLFVAVMVWVGVSFYSSVRTPQTSIPVPTVPAL